MPTNFISSGDPATELVLKTMAPRAPAGLLARARLNAESAESVPGAGCQIVVVQAGAGYGKTSLLAQWRREFLSRGAAVAWLLADERDDAERFLRALVHAIRTGCARPAFGRFISGSAGAPAGAFDLATAWLAELAQLSLDVVLIVDEADRLPASGAQLLDYVMHNAPQNLRIVAAGRQGLDKPVAELLAYGQAVLVGPDALRFRVDETIALVTQRFGARVNADACARLFEITDGWPLGLQLALTAMARAQDPRAALDNLAAGPRGLREPLVAALLTELSSDDERFLTYISAMDVLHPDLCAALTDDAQAPRRLVRLARDTPVFVTAEESDWCRLHPLVRDVLQTRFGALADAERAELHRRAARWLGARGMLEQAARHAHAAGEREHAYELAERSLHDAVKQGQLGTVLDWLERLPEPELEKRPRLRLAVAWALALGERHREAQRQVERVLASPGADDALRYECALILSAAAWYSDDPDRFLALFEPWAQQPPAKDSWLAQAHANRLAARAMLLGEPAQARRLQQAVTRAQIGKGLGYVVRWGDHMVGLTWMREGQVKLAESVLLPALASAEDDLGRRHPLTCMFAATCASIAYEDDRIDEAGALLANRLDVLERAAMPEAVVLAYRTAARIAALRGDEHRALDLLEMLHAMGVARGLPRLCVTSLVEQVSVHAGRYRAQTCDALVERIDALVDEHIGARGPIWRQSVQMLQAMAHGSAALARQDWRAAIEPFARAEEIAATMKLGRQRIELMALRALALERASAEGRAPFLEALNLARTYHLGRVLVDAHPALADWARSVSEEGEMKPGERPIVPPHVVRVPPRSGEGGPRALPSVILTPKEREILELLARNLTNKEIALAAAVGEGTVKWHLKNLFGKLDASSRKHAVRRAIALGLLEGVH
ncbi:LuxR C-terminal-related transcriptional regulator [Caballeronia ptereochthonis]|uniref:ATP-dependent transcription regulator LuxR n=1 Tax=Caballeronia ptereochthonis TaxID=1777144 RepID=A0A158B845_9BURK|nr:LuxR C-terminal-related transcriptional regulator [Caballeronia ptereochthonis]SAK66242.1 ATP-dependent transcription regulator LuxR [Caballeronia ptereochthonis]